MSPIAKRDATASLCIMPWVNMHVATTGAISPCCEFGGEYANLSTHTMKEAWNCGSLVEIREAFLNKTPLKECRKCTDREKNEGQSLRLESNERFYDHFSKISTHSKKTDFPISLDLRFSNLCNFKCRSCWHGASSKWHMDSKAIGLTVSKKAEISSFKSVEDFLLQVLPSIDSIEYLYFAGGEPLLLEEHYALLEHLIKIGKTDIAISYNSNMSVTALKQRSILDLWMCFPNVKIHASIDANGDLGKNIRSGFNWEVYVANIRLVREKCPHVTILFGITISAMNINSLPVLFDALERECGANIEDFYVHSLQDPTFYRTQVLPKEVKDSAAQSLEAYIKRLTSRPDLDQERNQVLAAKLNGLIQYMMAENKIEELPKFVERTLALDDLRKEDSAEVLPMLRRYLKKRSALMRQLLKISYFLKRSKKKLAKLWL